jgi:thioredoxin-dependent peroxiredoxin
MKLQPGQSAPLFSLKDVFGRIIDLKAYSGNKVFIGFFRHAGCPFCNLRVHALTKIQPVLKAAGMEMIFFFESKETVILRSTFHQEISPIPLLSDPQKIQYNAYGVESSGVRSAISHVTSFIPTVIKAKSAGVPVHLMADEESISTMPAEFLIDKGLVIHKALYATSLTDRLDLELIKAFAGSATKPV